MKASQPAPISISCTFLGGWAYPCTPGEIYTLKFGPRGIDLTLEWRTGSKLEPNSQVTIPYYEIDSLEITGPGSVTTNGGYVGGGFGVQGIIESIAIAGILNALTKRTKIHAFITITTNLGELNFHYGELEPGALKILLAPVYAVLRSLDPEWISRRTKSLDLAAAQGLIDEQRLIEAKNQLSIAKPLCLENAAKTDDSQVPPGEKVLLGECPTCGEHIPLDSKSCSHCKVVFTRQWKPEPI